MGGRASTQVYEDGEGCVMEFQPGETSVSQKGVPRLSNLKMK